MNIIRKKIICTNNKIIPMDMKKSKQTLIINCIVIKLQVINI